VSNESLTRILDSLRKQGNASSLSGGLPSKKFPRKLDTNVSKDSVKFSGGIVGSVPTSRDQVKFSLYTPKPKVPQKA